MSRPRRRLQRVLLVVVGGLLLAIGYGQARDYLDSQTTRVERVETEEFRVEVDAVEHAMPGAADIRTIAADADVVFDRSFRVRPGDALTARLGSEDVVVVPGAPGEVRVVVRGVGEDVRAAFADRRFRADRSAGMLVVETRERLNSRPWGHFDADFVIELSVPETMELTLDTVSGDVRVGRLAADLSVDTGSGDVALGTIAGSDIEVNTGSGNVRAQSLAGSVEIDTGSGDIEIDRIVGSLEADTGSGSLLVRAADAARIDADTGSGDIDLAFAAVGDTEVSSGSGDITFHVSPTDGAAMDLRSRDVQIGRGFTYTGETGRDGHRGRLGEVAGSRLRADTNGRIRVEAR